MQIFIDVKTLFLDALHHSKLIHIEISSQLVIVHEVFHVFQQPIKPSWGGIVLPRPIHSGP